MFPSPATIGYFGVGIFGNAFDLLAPVTLDSLIATYINGAGATVATGDLAGLVAAGSRSPWNGIFVAPNTVGAFSGTGGVNVRTLRAEFNVTVIPEPATLMAFGGLVVGGGLIARRRRTVVA
jgi:hypothetical protein